MKTLIELFDDRPLENVLAADVFRPERVVFLCPGWAAQSKRMHEGVRSFFKSRGLETECIFLETSVYKTDKVEKQLRSIIEEYPDCALDITGGTDAVLFAAGITCRDANMAVFTYSRTKNCFFSINAAEFAEGRQCDAVYGIEEFFTMAGGAMKKGRVDNGTLSAYLDDIDPFFDIYLSHRKKWVGFINWMQRASAAKGDGSFSLSVESNYTVKGNRGAKISADEEILTQLRRLEFIKYLEILKDRSVSFSFRDGQIRYWLRDIGSVLELYVYKACIDAGIFDEVRCSVIVDWESDATNDVVSNEIDVTAIRGITPVFISCKTCAIDTDALNELAILMNRFGGEMAKAVIVSTENCRSITRARAAALGISVIDLEDIRAGELSRQIRQLME